MHAASRARWERGQSTVFFASFVVILAVLTAVVLEVGRLAYARGEVAKRSEERRVGKECPSLCRSRWSPYH